MMQASRMLCVLALPSAAIAQVPSFDWAVHATSVAIQQAKGVAADGVGGAYVTGPSNSLVNGSADSGEGIVVYHVTNTGAIDWLLQTGGTSDAESHAVASDATGAFVVGSFRGNASFGSASFASSGGQDVFVLRIDTAGTILWTSVVGGAGDDDARGVATDGGGGAYVVGSFEGTTNFGTMSRTSTGGSDAFVLHVNGGGTVDWAVSGGGRQDDVARGVAYDGLGGALVTGTLRHKATFGLNNFTSAGSTDVVAFHVTGTGEIDWAVRAGTTGPDAGEGITSDGSGGALVCGVFRSNQPFGSSPLTLDGGEVKVFHVTSMGVRDWTVKVSGTAAVHGIATDAANGAYVVGAFTSTATFGSASLTSAQSADGFVMHVTANGAIDWAESASGSSAVSATAIAADRSGCAFATGSFLENVTIGDASLSAALSEEPATFVLSLASPQGSCNLPPSSPPTSPPPRAPSPSPLPLLPPPSPLPPLQPPSPMPPTVPPSPLPPSLPPSPRPPTLPPSPLQPSPSPQPSPPPLALPSSPLSSLSQPLVADPLPVPPDSTSITEAMSTDESGSSDWATQFGLFWPVIVGPILLCFVACLMFYCCWRDRQKPKAVAAKITTVDITRASSVSSSVSEWYTRQMSMKGIDVAVASGEGKASAPAAAASALRDEAIAQSSDVEEGIEIDVAQVVAEQFCAEGGAYEFGGEGGPYASSAVGSALRDEPIVADGEAKGEAKVVCTNGGMWGSLRSFAALSVGSAGGFAAAMAAASGIDNEPHNVTTKAPDGSVEAVSEEAVVAQESTVLKPAAKRASVFVTALRAGLGLQPTLEPVAGEPSPFDEVVEAELATLFRRCDTDRSGTLGRVEFARALQILNLDRHLQLYGKNHGTVVGMSQLFDDLTNGAGEKVDEAQFLGLFRKLSEAEHTLPTPRERPSKMTSKSSLEAYEERQRGQYEDEMKHALERVNGPSKAPRLWI